jgi:hypothetical protein
MFTQYGVAPLFLLARFLNYIYYKPKTSNRNDKSRSMCMKFVLANLGKITNALVRVGLKQDGTSRRGNLLSATLNRRLRRYCSTRFKISPLYFDRQA